MRSLIIVDWITSLSLAVGGLYPEIPGCRRYDASQNFCEKSCRVLRVPLDERKNYERRQARIGSPLG